MNNATAYTKKNIQYIYIVNKDKGKKTLILFMSIKSLQVAPSIVGVRVCVRVNASRREKKGREEKTVDSQYSMT